MSDHMTQVPQRAATILDRARDALNARMTKDNLLLVLENVIAYAAGLEAEREKLVRWHGEDSKSITTLVARVERHRARLVALQNDALSMRGSLAPADGDRKVPFELGDTLTPAVDWLIARVAELEENLRAVNAGWAVARKRIAELERPAVEAKRDEVRQSYAELAAQCREDRDHEGAFDVECRLREREEQWKREDEEATR